MAFDSYNSTLHTPAQNPRGCTSVQCQAANILSAHQIQKLFIWSRHSLWCFSPQAQVRLPNQASPHSRELILSGMESMLGETGKTKSMTRKNYGEIDAECQYCSHTEIQFRDDCAFSIQSRESCLFDALISYMLKIHFFAFEFSHFQESSQGAQCSAHHHNLRAPESMCVHILIDAGVPLNS